MIGNYCRQYRIKNGVKLKDLTNGEQIKTLSAFECGNSSNVKHLEKYIKLSNSLNDYEEFSNGLLNEVLNNVK